MKSRPKSARVVPSKFQEKFQKEQVYKRNRDHFNLQTYQTINLNASVLRRRPLHSQDNFKHHKFHSSFTQSTLEPSSRTEKLTSDQRHRNTKLRKNTNLSLDLRSKKSQKRQHQEKNKIRSFSMQKMTSREYHHSLRNKACPDERLFANFQSFQVSTPCACNISHMKPKVLDNTLYHFNDLEYDTQKTYQKYYYHSDAAICKVNFEADKKYNKKGRKFFKSSRPQNVPFTDLDWESVDRGAKISTHYKESNISKGGTIEFFRGIDKNLPSQTDMRQMNELTRHWVDENGKISRQKLDYYMQKMKEEMQNERLNGIKSKKQPEIQRQKMCDARFFTYTKQ